MAASVRIWTWDCGFRDVALDGDDPRLVQVLQTVLEGGLWEEFRKFPPAVVARVLPCLNLPTSTRRLVEIWVEEARARAAA